MKNPNDNKPFPIIGLGSTSSLLMIRDVIYEQDEVSVLYTIFSLLGQEINNAETIVKRHQLIENEIIHKDSGEWSRLFGIPIEEINQSRIIIQYNDKLSPQIVYIIPVDVANNDIQAVYLNTEEDKGGLEGIGDQLSCIEEKTVNLSPLDTLKQAPEIVIECTFLEFGRKVKRLIVRRIGD